MAPIDGAAPIERPTTMNLSPTRFASVLAGSVFVAAATALVAGCAGMMPPPGTLPVGHHPGMHAGAAHASEAHEAPAARRNNCITETPCNYNSDCSGGNHCNFAMHRCFEPDPVASTVLTCDMNACTWDSECPAGWSCNSASRHCQLR